MKENAYRTCIKFTDRFNRDELPIGAFKKFTYYAVPKGYVLLPDEYQKVQIDKLKSTVVDSRVTADKNQWYAILFVVHPELPAIRFSEIRGWTYITDGAGNLKWGVDEKKIAIGIDVASPGGDRTVIALNEGGKITLYDDLKDIPHGIFKQLFHKNKAKNTEDNINKPSHYTKGQIEPFDLIRAQKLDFAEGSVVKYIVRYKHKGKPLEDLKKARWYIDRLIENEETKK